MKDTQNLCSSYLIVADNVLMLQTSKCCHFPEHHKTFRGTLKSNYRKGGYAIKDKTTNVPRNLERQDMMKFNKITSRNFYVYNSTLS